MNRRIGAAIFGTVLVLVLILAARSQHNDPAQQPGHILRASDTTGATAAAIREIRATLASPGPRGQHPDPVIAVTGHLLGGDGRQARIAIEGRLASGVPVAFVVFVTRRGDDWLVAEVRP